MRVWTEDFAGKAFQPSLAELLVPLKGKGSSIGWMTS